ncbi:MAG: NAD(P)/FAD-dependent oxidoreductase [Mangrovibacterium sp.]
MKLDYLIIGQGLAGTLLGFELMKAGNSVHYIDAPDFRKASSVAAGLINPVVFRRLTKSWLVDELYPHMLKTYADLENQLGRAFFVPMKICKVFGQGEADFWRQKSIENQLEPYLTVEPDFSPRPFLNLPHGCGWVEKSGRVDLPGLLDSFRKHLLQGNLLQPEIFDFSKLEIHQDGIQYKNFEARKIIFCEGHRASQNPFFGNIKFKHTKGEVLDLTISNYQSDNILNKACFLMPAGENRFRLGATYDWDQLDEIPTERGKNELTAKLEHIFTADYRISGHRAGIRPTTHDRRPVIGLHSAHPAVGIFNGLGSKGCLLGPYFARQFSDYLTSKTGQLHPEVDVARYFGAEP